MVCVEIVLRNTVSITYTPELTYENGGYTLSGKNLGFLNINVELLHNRKNLLREGGAFSSNKLVDVCGSVTAIGYNTVDSPR